MMTKFSQICSFSLAMLLALHGYSQKEFKPITLEDVFKSRTFVSGRTPGMHPMRDGNTYCRVTRDSLNVYNYVTGDYVRTLVTTADLIPSGDSVPVPLYSFELSDDESRILFAADEESIYRYSSKAYYYIYDIATRKLVPLSDGEKQRLATFSPDASMVAFIRDNNLFIKPLATSFVNMGGTDRDPVDLGEQQITFDGEINHIINGATDWVYEEEFGFTKAFFWSPDSRKIAFYRFDESRVKEFTLQYYGGIYPENYTYKYPKAGEDNSIVDVMIYHLESGATVTVNLGSERDIYIPRIKWTNDPETLAIYRMNRHQNHLELLLAGSDTGETTLLLDETNPWYIEITDDLTFLRDGKRFLITSEKDGFNQIYLYDMSGQLIRQLTTEDQDVTALYGVDEETGQVYYQVATTAVDRNLYTVSIEGKKSKPLTKQPGFNSAQWSSNFRYFIHTWSTINTPPVVTLCKADGTEIRVLETNEKLKERMKEYGFQSVDFFTVPTDDGLTLNGWMLKPPSFDPQKKYPVLFTIYGGPGSQTVLNRWGSASTWNQYMAQQGIIVVSVDNRGTGARGQDFKKCTYRELGKYETLDQIAAAQYLADLSYVDPERIGMWGWSFGGYLTLSCMTKGAEYFSVGVAVAPVTNWKYYDNIYTERFMRTPGENEQGYEENSPVNHAGKLSGKLLIIHGMADDNVHPQNTYDMVTALVAADKKFSLQLYPNSNHGIYSGKNTTWHNYSRMTDFLLKHLLSSEEEE